MDIGVRQETLTTMPGQPVLVQLPLIPAYALTVHKTQALSIKHIVRGCIEGVFAQGQVYVLISRVTDPSNLQLVGLPPLDLLDAVMAAWTAAGLDAIECLRNAVSVTKDWVYDPDPSLAYHQRIKPRRKSEKLVSVKWRKLKEILNPQPRAQEVIHKLLDWIERVDKASQTGAPRPTFETVGHEPIFPEDDEDKWWLTDVQNRKEPAAQQPGDEDGPPSSEGEHVSDEDKMVSDEDPMSEDECEHAVLGSQEDVEQRPSFVPRAHWPRCEAER